MFLFLTKSSPALESNFPVSVFFKIRNETLCHTCHTITSYGTTFSHLGLKWTCPPDVIENESAGAGCRSGIRQGRTAGHPAWHAGPLRPKPGTPQSSRPWWRNCGWEIPPLEGKAARSYPDWASGAGHTSTERCQPDTQRVDLPPGFKTGEKTLALIL